jgi:hypothetical protein
MARDVQKVIIIAARSSSNLSYCDKRAGSYSYEKKGGE